MASVAALAVAVALPVHAPRCSPTAHYAMARSLAAGRADIDRYHWQTCDKSYIGGHFYANKAPGLPAVLAPFWKLLRALGASDPVPTSAHPRALYDVPALAIWPLTLLGAALPAVLLFLVLARLGHRVEPGLGIAAAACVSLGTLLLPLSSLLLSHVLAALLGLAAFALLFPASRQLSTAALVSGGMLAGLAVTTEYPLALVAAGLGLYALRRGDLVRRALAYGGGLAAGVLPLLAYNQWAFGSPRTLSYTNGVIEQGQTGHDKVGSLASGFYGVDVPRLEVAVELLLSQKGLVASTPVVAAGLAGLVPLARRGFPREAALVGGLCIANLAYLAGYEIPFGGDGPGARLLTPVLPFLVLPLAVALRTSPMATLALALVSALMMAIGGATDPLLPFYDTDVWARRLLRGEFAEMLPSVLGPISPTVAALPFFAALLVMGTAAALSLGLGRPAARDGRVALVALLGWTFVAGVSSRAIVPDRDDSALALVLAVGAPLAVAGVAVVVWRKARV